MKILHVIPYHPSPSAFVFAKRQVRDLQIAGHQNEIYYFNTQISPILFLRQWFEFRKIRNAFQPDIIHAHYGTYTGFFAGFMHDGPLVITFQGSDINHTSDVHPWREKLGKWMSKNAANKARGIICVSQKIFDLLPIGKEKAKIIPCGIDVRIFHPMNREECKKKLQLSPDTHYVFFNANNPVVKRLDIAQEVIQAMSSKYSVKLLTLNGGIHPDEIPTYMNACDGLLLCSDSEGSPMVIKEALACEIPIVSVAVGDVLDRISGVNHCFITPQNSAELSSKLAFILENTGLKTNGREKLQNDELDSITTIEKIIQLYEKSIQ
jgi:glycosyltransferase involved in cell wall biosynthesis